MPDAPKSRSGKKRPIEVKLPVPVRRPIRRPIRASVKAKAKAAVQSAKGLRKVIVSGILRSADVDNSYGRNLWMSPWHESAAYLPP
jgi:hypothetical protein